MLDFPGVMMFITWLVDATTLLDTVIVVLSVGGQDAHHHLGVPRYCAPDRPQKSSRPVVRKFYPG